MRPALIKYIQVSIFRAYNLGIEYMFYILEWFKTITQTESSSIIFSYSCTFYIYYQYTLGMSS
jgi:hypothetical protein